MSGLDNKAKLTLKNVIFILRKKYSHYLSLGRHETVRLNFLNEGLYLLKDG